MDQETTGQKKEKASRASVAPGTARQEDAAEYKALNEARSGGFLSRIGTRFNDAIQQNRGAGQNLSPVSTSPVMAQRSVDDVALMRARATRAQKMVIPEGVIIEGSLTGGSETEIHGRIEGNVTVEGALYLGKTALVTGNVRAGACQVEGMVEGKVECTDGLYLTAGGRLNADAMAGKQIRIAGRIQGNVTTPGNLRLESGAVVNGDIRARVLSMDEGAVLNGRCVMRAPSQRADGDGKVAERKDNV